MQNFFLLIFGLKISGNFGLRIFFPPVFYDPKFKFLGNLSSRFFSLEILSLKFFSPKNFDSRIFFLGNFGSEFYFFENFDSRIFFLKNFGPRIFFLENLVPEIFFLEKCGSKIFSLVNFEFIMFPEILRLHNFYSGNLKKKIFEEKFGLKIIFSADFNRYFFFFFFFHN